MNNWREVKLDDVCIQITDGVHNTVVDDANADCLLLSCKNIKDGRVFIGNNERKINFDTLNKLRKRTKTAKDDILISSVGTIGETAIINEDNPKYEFQRSVLMVKPDPDKSYPKFLLYYLKNLKDYFNSSATGAVQKCLFIGSVKDLDINIPPLEEQGWIAGVLGALDDKIEANRKQNETLEATAQAIFKSWFLDFEPFSGQMPPDWKYGKLSDVIKDIESGSRSKGGAVDSGVPSIGAENIEKFGVYNFDKEKYISEIFFENMKRGIIKSSDVLLYKDGAYTGKVSMVLDGFPHKKAAVNEHVFILRTNDLLPSQFFLYLFMSQKQIIETMATLGASKAAQPGLNQTDVGSVSVIIPEKSVIKEFDNIVSPMMHKIAYNALESRNLAQVRDSLLPRLMSGTLRIPINKKD